MTSGSISIDQRAAPGHRGLDNPAPGGALEGLCRQLLLVRNHLLLHLLGLLHQLAHVLWSHSHGEKGNREVAGGEFKAPEPKAPSVLVDDLFDHLTTQQAFDESIRIGGSRWGFQQLMLVG